jgi:hypothetical protein
VAHPEAAATAAAPAALTLLELNWVPALYAHPSWWGALTSWRSAAPERGQRLVARVSAGLIAELGLAGRTVQHAPGWSLLTAAPFGTLAQRLGRIALAERVRHALDRRAVLHSLALLGSNSREQAYQDAQNWPALAAVVGAAEPLPADAEALAEVGGSVLAALLPAGAEGQRERLALRFRRGAQAARPRALNDATAAEARAWLAGAAA